MKILLTGSTGMIGQSLVKRLGNTHTIVEFARSKGMDITRLEDVEKAIHGVDIVIHAAAELDERKGEEAMRRTNVEGTRNLVTAAEEEGIDQFIHVSTVGVYGETQGKITETSEMNPRTAYERTKKEAEAMVWNMQEVFPVTIIRPAIVVGPNTYWASIFKTIRKGFPLIGKGTHAWQMIQIDDLVEFITLCVGNEETYNEAYLVAEKETHSLREVVNMIADIQHTPRPGTIPTSVGIVLSHLFGIQGKLLGKKPLLTPPHVKRMLKHREYDITKALKTHWKPTHTTRKALEKTFAQLTEKGLL
ncbi:MAG: NAD-dependent epimerase/dehydratase family protein [archaeon]